MTSGGRRGDKADQVAPISWDSDTGTDFGTPVHTASDSGPVAHSEYTAPQASFETLVSAPAVSAPPAAAQDAPATGGDSDALADAMRQLDEQAGRVSALENSVQALQLWIEAIEGEIRSLASRSDSVSPPPEPPAPVVEAVPTLEALFAPSSPEAPASAGPAYEAPSAPVHVDVPPTPAPPVAGSAQEVPSIPASLAALGSEGFVAIYQEVRVLHNSLVPLVQAIRGSGVTAPEAQDVVAKITDLMDSYRAITDAANRLSGDITRGDERSRRINLEHMASLTNGTEDVIDYAHKRLDTMMKSQLIGFVDWLKSNGSDPNSTALLSSMLNQTEIADITPRAGDRFDESRHVLASYVDGGVLDEIEEVSSSGFSYKGAVVSKAVVRAYKG